MAAVETTLAKIDIKLVAGWRGWLQRLVRCAFCLECAPYVSVMKHGQQESGRCEKGDNRAYTDDKVQTRMRGRRPRLVINVENHENRESGDHAIGREKKGAARPFATGVKREC